MKSLFLALILGLTGSLSQAATHTHAKSHKLCTGFTDENNYRFPINHRDPTGISEEDFNGLLDKINLLYADEIKDLGAELVIERKWTDNTANAYASRTGNKWLISMFGGLARHPEMTKDGFALVACHELGHHIGGAPKKLFTWAGVEGQADYYGTLKCFRRYIADDDNISIMNSDAIDAYAKKECMSEFTNVADQAVCARSSMAGLVLGKVLKSLGNEANEIDFQTPDPKTVTFTATGHPKAQCRLDTYFNGSRCPVAVSENVSGSNYKDGTCDKTSTFNTGSRPRCWFKP